jgi:shikimate dehydrogenase
MDGRVVTKLCAVVTGSDGEELVLRARRALDRGADMVELRLDHLPNPDEGIAAVLDVLANHPAIEGGEVVVSLRAPVDGGAYPGKEEDRVSLLEALATSAATWVDLEGYLPSGTLAHLTTLARSANTRTVLSWHLEGSEGFDGLASRTREAVQDRLVDAVKIVLVVDDRRSLERYLAVAGALAAEGISHVTIPSGRLSRIGRMMAPLASPEWVYVENVDQGYLGHLGLPRFDEISAAWRRTGLRPDPEAPPRPAPPLSWEDVEGEWTLLAILGDPVAHTNSPVLHHTAMSALGIRGVYVPYRTALGDVAGALEDLETAGAVGCNVTVPLKVEAAAEVRRLGEGARLSGAVNTIVLGGREGRVGENTDVDGVRLTVEEIIGPTGSGRRALVLGTGGAARGAIVGLDQWGAEVLVTGRDRERLEAMVGQLGGMAQAVDHRDLHSWAGTVDILVQCTSQGMVGVPPEGPLEPARAFRALRPCAVLDMVYARGGTTLVREARASGLPTAGGERPLLHQAVVAFYHWTGRRPPVRDMEIALETAIG